MLYEKNLEDIIFNRHRLIEVDELIIISGYIGPDPVEKLKELPIKSKVVYGMYGNEGIKKDLHNTLLQIQNSAKNLDILYSNLTTHAKCYVWKNKGKIIQALVGSANFSKNGLMIPYREILAETDIGCFNTLKEYIQKILNNAISCLELGINEALDIDRNSICSLSLLGKNGEVQDAAGLNWGQSPKGHITKNDSYITIRKQDVENHPKLFPPKQIKPSNFDGKGKKHRHNDYIEIIWDDGIRMTGLLFGSQPLGSILYPKQVSSFPAAIMGKYLRQRLKVPSEQSIRKFHLNKYGRDTIEISLISEGVYKFDFSV